MSTARSLLLVVLACGCSDYGMTHYTIKYAGAYRAARRTCGYTPCDTRST